MRCRTPRSTPLRSMRSGRIKESPPTRGSETRRTGAPGILAAGRIARSSRLTKYGAPRLIAARALPFAGSRTGASQSRSGNAIGVSRARASSWGMRSIFPRGSGLQHVTLAALTLSLAVCDTSGKDADVAEAPSAQGAFWSELTALCGKAYGGRVAESVPPDTVMSRQSLVMHVRNCGPDTIRVPFHVGENRSRTWVITRTASGLRLKHDHRHEDGAPDSVTMYGGDTRDTGLAGRQEFFADSLTASLIPAARTNVWTIEVQPGRTFAYVLRREGSERRFRAEFDLSTPVPIPPAAWGASR